MPSLVLTARQTPWVVADSGGTHTINMSGLLANTGVASEIIDLEVGFAVDKSPGLYEVKTVYQLASAGILDNHARTYIANSDGTKTVGRIVQGAVTEQQTRNLTPAGQAVVDTTAINTDIIKSEVVYIPTRYCFVVFFAPDGTAALVSSTTVHSITLTPVPDENQD